MILLIDTTKDSQGNVLATKIGQIMPDVEYEYVDASQMNISECLGCNMCWLRTPGECVIKDDYEEILKKIHKANQVWFVTETKFGFMSYKTKNIIDRLMPLVTVNIEFRDKLMRHIARYDNNPDWGLIYVGEGDENLLNMWCKGFALNFSGKALGAYNIDEYKEAMTCMY